MNVIVFLIIECLKLFTYCSCYKCHSTQPSKDLRMYHYKSLNMLAHMHCGNLNRLHLCHMLKGIVEKKKKKDRKHSHACSFKEFSSVNCSLIHITAQMTIMEDVLICTSSIRLTLVLRFAISPAVTTAQTITVVGATTITTARTR